ncbi:scarecrow protein [Salix suchowensis]|nr:scarecrow protein [Salix suchowensis]
MASGFSGGGGGGGGGGQDFYTNRSPIIPTMNLTNNHHNPSSLPPYRTNQMFLEQNLSSPNYQQIAQQRAIFPTTTSTTNLIGKRTLADFQAFQQSPPQQNLLNQAALNNLLLRSVKPRVNNNIFQQNTSPISTLDFSVNNLSPELPSLMSQRYGLPLLQQLRPQHHHQQHQQQPMNLISPLGVINNKRSSSNSMMPYVNMLQNQNGGGNGIVMGQDREKRMLNQLQELEKQLLDDDDDNQDGDAVSGITNSNSEWSETIHNLITSTCNNPISPSPSSSSSSSSSTVTTPVSKHTVIEAASAIYEGKTDVYTEILTRVSLVSNPGGNSEQRLMGYMLTALKSRLNSAGNTSAMELYSKEHVDATQLLYELSPCFKLGFMAANLAIIDATREQKQEANASSNGFHVVDFDIGHGGQYMNLLLALSGLQNSKPAIVKITAVASDSNGGEERLRPVGEMLSQLARRVGLNLCFKVVSCKLNELARESLGCEQDEALAVNFAFNLYRMPDESVSSTENLRDELLRRVKGLAPRVVTVVEQEMNTNTAPFMARVNESCSYYGALFDSIESTVERDSSERAKVEEGLGRRIVNSVACEGRDRVERCEVFGKWRARLGMAGFELKPLSQNIAESMKTRLNLANRVNPGFTVKEENGGVCFGWTGKTLTVASAWR